MRKIITTFLFLVALLSLGSLQAQDKEWTLLVYMVGSDIVSDGITDLGEMTAAGNTDNINIVAMLGGSNLEGWQTPTTSTFVNGTEMPQTFTPSQPSMTISSSLTEFIDWGIENYPANKYMLVFYNHGMAIRGWGWDETIDAQNSVSDIQNGIAASQFITNGHKFEVIGFDACLMATFEVMSALRNFGHYYIASEETEPYHAWNWTPVITAMNTQSNLTGSSLGTIIVDNYFAQHESENTHNVTLSVVELAKITALETSLEVLVDSLNDDLYLENLIRARAESEEYSKSTSNPAQSEDMVDIGDLASHLVQFEPILQPLTDDVIAKVSDAVVYHRSDDTRPQSTGISMFLPLNTLTNHAEVDFRINSNLVQIDYSSTIKNFIKDEYLPFAQSDDNPLAGEIDIDFNGLVSDSQNKDLLNGIYSAVRIPSDHVEDLDHLQVILLEEIVGIPDEFLVLGSTYADTSVVNPDGSSTFAYQWDDQWLGLNGHPAYVSDIQYIDVFDDDGNLDYEFTRIHIPAVLNPGTENEKEIAMSFTFDEDFNHRLEGITREPYGQAVSVPSKERIMLQPGDQVRLVYEVFDAQTNEAFFVENEDATFMIENGNEDLDLEHTPLEPGTYHLGFVLMDHAQNDTIIYDPTVHEVVMVNTGDLAKEELGVRISPNPADDFIQIQFEEPVTATLELFDAQGRQIRSRQITQGLQASMNIEELPAANYWLRISTEDHVFTRKLSKQ